MESPMQANGFTGGNAAANAQPTQDATSYEERIAQLEKRVSDLEAKQPDERLSMVVFSGDLDKLLASFIIATGAAAMGKQVSIFFTFWGLNALRKQRVLKDKNAFEKAMSLMTPATTQGLGVSKLNFFGVGARMLRAMMRRKQVTSLEELIELAEELGVELVACEMSRDVMGIRDDEFREGIEVGGVATFLDRAFSSRTTLFI